MNASKQPFEPVPVDDDTIFKLIDDSTIGVNGSSTPIFSPGKNPFSSTKQFVDNLARYFLSLLYPSQILEEGMRAKILEPGKKWVTGMIRLRLVVEFIPDELENNGTTDKLTSSLDDIRSRSL